MAIVPADGGIRFGSYVLIRRIARGGMAEVFLAQQRGLEGFDRRVAVKRILPHLVDSPDFVKMFLGEARLAAQLTHPNIVHIYDFGKVDNDYFIAMEYVEGVHAGQIFKLGDRVIDRISPTLVARIGADAASALHYAHELRNASGKTLGLVHRDVSPANLMVSYDGVVKLCDFGIAKAAAVTDQLTNPGQVKGKYAYMSPEQTIAAPLDGRSDVFSLAIVLWELLAGKTIVPRGDAVEAMRSIRDGRLPALAAVAPSVPKPLVDAITWALATKREQRATASDLAGVLEAFIKASPEMATSMHLGAWVRTRFPREATGPQQAIMFPGPVPNTPQTGVQQGTVAAPGTMAAPATVGSAEGMRLGAVTPPAAQKAATLVIDDNSETIAMSKDDLAAARPTLIDKPMRFPLPRPSSSSRQDATLLETPAHQRDPDTDNMFDAADEGETVLRSGGQRPFTPNAAAIASVERQYPQRRTPVPTATEAMMAARRHIPRQLVVLGAALFALSLVSFLIVLRCAGSPSNAPADATGLAVASDARPLVTDVASLPDALLVDAIEPTLSVDAAPKLTLLQIRTIPSGATVTIGDQKRIAPAEFLLPAGKYQVLAELDGYQSERRPVEVIEGLRLVREIAFNKRIATAPPTSKTGKLTVRTEPWADVFIGTRKIGQTPFEIEWPVGQYTLIFKNPAHTTTRRTITVYSNKTTKVGPFNLPP